ncbi:MAG TPA: sigma-54 dependent transcriptional regulator [Thermoanaerobaculia bacterium]|nr:sigma-54 dependent transcriptional regulator [Thermoanaerobaculia bacterium]
MPEETRELTAQVPIWDGEHQGGERRKRSRARVPGLTLLFHPETRRVGERVLLGGLPAGRTVYLSRTEPEFAHPGENLFHPLEDRHVSRSPLRLATANETGAVRLSIGESRTRVVADGMPVMDARVFSPRDLERGVVLELAGRIVLLFHLVPVQAFQTPERYGLVGDSEAILRVRHEMRRVADLDVPVLLRGETGTGKELVAQAIHRASRRRSGPCLSVNMAAIPASLAASELFGAVKGSFTGSTRDHAGFFQRAHGGTLFLDEIGEAPLEVQVMLLRALETGEVQRIGAQELQKVDVRLIAATDTDLERAIEEGSFRAPLLHRLAGYEILIPPLRERRDDFGRLLFHFLREELRAAGEEHRLEPPGEEDQPWMPASVVARLARYDWPGNIRQLHNTVRQIVISSRSFDVVQIGPQVERLLREAAPPVTPEDAVLEPTLQEPAPPRKRPAGDYRNPSEVTEAEVIDALRTSHWEVKQAAEMLGISRPSLYVLMERFPSIRKASDLTRAEILESHTLCGGDLDAMVARLEVSKRGLQQRMKQLGIG